LAINNNGEIVGTADKPLEMRSSAERLGKPWGWFAGIDAPMETVAVLWSAGHLIELETLYDAGEAGDSAYGINDDGLVVGNSREAAVYWVSGRVHRLDLIGSNYGAEYGVASDANKRGQVVGTLYTYGALLPLDPHPFLWENGYVVDLGEEFFQASEMEETGEIVGHASRINETGQIVGMQSTVSGPPRALVWEDGRPMNLDSPTHGVSSATDINDRGAVVGYYTAADGRSRACLWA
jgi:probable HAF family extracellular repeat protein